MTQKELYATISELNRRAGECFDHAKHSQNGQGKWMDEGEEWQRQAIELEQQLPVVHRREECLVKSEEQEERRGD